MEAGTPPRAGWRKADLFARPNATAPPTLFILPNATDAARLAADVPFDILDTYSDSFLITVAIERLDRLRELATPLLMGFIERDDYDVIWTGAGPIDTRYPVSVPTRGLPDAKYAAGQLGAYLIQFHGPEKAEWLTTLRDSGAVPIWSQAYNGYVIVATPEVAAAVQQRSFVQWTTPLHPYLKNAPRDSDFRNGVVAIYVFFARVPGSSAAVERLFGPNAPTLDYSFAPVTSAGGLLSRAAVSAMLEEPLVVDSYVDRGGGTGGGVPQIPTLSPFLLGALAIVLAAVALRR